MLDLGWGMVGVEEALACRYNIVIIDVLRFSSATIAATARGFVVAPSTDRYRRRESGERLSPAYYEGAKPRRVEIYSSNGAALSIAAAGAKNAYIGALLNAKAVARRIDGLGHCASLIAAGEIDVERRGMMDGYETEMAGGNGIFCIEDMLGAGAIAHFSKMALSEKCAQAERFFKLFRTKLAAVLGQSATGKFNESRGMGADTRLCSALNSYDVVPKVSMVDDVAEISAARAAAKR